VIRPRLFVEAPAGLAAVSLRLQGGAPCRPPVSRLGSKQGYGGAILGALGLHSGQGADAYWWAEADADVRALLACWPDPEALAEVAAILRGWQAEEPRQLWTRLRDQRRARGCREGAEALAEYVVIHQSNRLINVAGPDLVNTGKGGTTFGGGFALPVSRLAERFEAAARAAYLLGGSYQFKGPDAGIGRPEGHPATGHTPTATLLPRTFGREAAAGRSWPPVHLSSDLPDAATLSAALGTPGDLECVVVYSDPPYEGTTGYGHELPRAVVLDLARGWASAGATVAISEAVPLDDALGGQWEAIEITGEGKVPRGFSAQKREWLTISKPPVGRPGVQLGLWGAACPA